MAAHAFFPGSGQLSTTFGFGGDDAIDAITDYLLVHWPFHAQKSELGTNDSAFGVELNSFLGLEGDMSSKFPQWRQSTIAFINTLPPREKYQCKLYRFITPTEAISKAPYRSQRYLGFRSTTAIFSSLARSRWSI